MSDSMTMRGQARTAFITGASSGIGAAFARRLAREGYDLTLVARREERLAMLERELESSRGVAVHTIVADLADPAGLEKVEQSVASLPRLDLLISSAGFGARGDFAGVDIGRQSAMIRLHVLAATRLTHAALPGMVQRGQGEIIHVASLSAFVVVRGDAVYNATKAYLVTFSRTLHEELRGSGVQIQALCPGFTRTELHAAEHLPDSDLTRIPAILWSSAEEVVESSLRSLARGQVVCVPGWKNRVILLLARLGVISLVLRAARP
jgi:short-subunit dehydrogenase